MKFSEKVNQSMAENNHKKLQWPVFFERFANILANKLFSNGIPIYLERGQTKGVGMNFFALTTGDIPYNTRSTPNNGLKVDSEYGCSLRYEQKHNGCIVCKLIGFDGEEFLYGTYSSPESIGAKRILIHIKAFEAVFFCTSKRLIPSFGNKLIFLIVKAKIIARSTSITKYLGTLMSITSKIFPGK